MGRHCAEEESDMQRSTHRILTTHVGSLARPDALIPLLRLKERGQPYDTEAFAQLVREAVADVARKQVEAGIDIVTDGGSRTFCLRIMFRDLPRAVGIVCIGQSSACQTC